MRRPFTYASVILGLERRQAIEGRAAMVGALAHLSREQRAELRRVPRAGQAGVAHVVVDVEVVVVDPHRSAPPRGTVVRAVTQARVRLRSDGQPVEFDQPLVIIG